MPQVKTKEMLLAELETCRASWLEAEAKALAASGDEAEELGESIWYYEGEYYAICRRIKRLDPSFEYDED